LRVLETLVVQAGTLVTREELRQRIWDEATYVEFDQGLNYCIRQIRLALGDDAATPVFIETLKKRGYRFTARVEAVGGGAETGRGDDPDAGKAPPPSVEAASAHRMPIPLRRWPRSRVYPGWRRHSRGGGCRHRRRAHAGPTAVRLPMTS
jgi:DNA-binding winged helix-turn-helix (wHTH) protein